MIRKILIASMVLAAVAFGAAQSDTYTISPVTGDGDDAISKGATEAEVEQTVTLRIPQATALHLDVTDLLFDLTDFNGNHWENGADGAAPASGPLCVYAVSEDLDWGSFSGNWGQTQIIPGGIRYTIEDNSEAWDKIQVTGERVTNYPPIRVEGGEVDNASKAHMVCYQSFIIQLFSNFKYWDLQVARDDKVPGKGIEHLYVQGNTCADFGDPTGLYKLPNESGPVHLIPTTINAGPTGKQVSQDGSQCRQNTSWLDVLGVLAVKVNSDNYGDSLANLTYTLLSSDTNTDW